MLHLLLVIFTFVELNCENLFDTQHDAGRQDEEFLPTSARRWTPHRYWQKLQHISQALVSCGETTGEGLLPDMALLTEVENDSVMRDLTRRTPLHAARYDYVMTDSPDERGIDVALIYSPFSFRLINHLSLRISPMEGHRATRDILYASGQVISGDTLHVYGLHAPSRLGGEMASRPYRLHVMQRLCRAIDSLRAISADPLIIVAGDFNDYSGDESLKLLSGKDMTEVSEGAVGSNGARGTYRYRSEWGSLDHIFCSASLARRLGRCCVNDQLFLLERDKKHGGVKPRRTYLGTRYHGGFSDHLPLVATFGL